MTYRVVYAPSFLEDVDQHVEYLLGEHVSVERIERWYTRVFKLVDSLDEWPRRFAVGAVMTRDTGRETRKVNVGDYLIFYQVDDDRQEVSVVTFMHGARRRET